jgi:hypothetical protein
MSVEHIIDTETIDNAIYATGVEVGIGKQDGGEFIGVGIERQDGSVAIQLFSIPNSWGLVRGMFEAIANSSDEAHASLAKTFIEALDKIIVFENLNNCPAESTAEES